MLIDLNPTQKAGMELLRFIKSSRTLKSIPVIVLSVSEDEEEVLESYDLYVNSYITKPDNVDDLVSVHRIMEKFWFAVVKLPSKTVR